MALLLHNHRSRLDHQAEQGHVGHFAETVLHA